MNGVEWKYEVAEIGNTVLIKVAQKDIEVQYLNKL